MTDSSDSIFLYGLYTDKNLDFDEFPNYMNKYFPECDGQALMKVLKIALREKSIVVAIGGWKGRSTAIMASRAVKYGGDVYMVNIEDYLLEDIFPTFKSNMVRLGLWTTIHLLLMESKIAAKIFSDNLLDMVFIDDEHGYSKMVSNITLWLPKLREGGILCGHDCGVYYPDWKVIVDNLKEDQDLLKYEGEPHGHVLSFGYPGVIKALHDCLGNKYNIVPDSNIWYYAKL